MFFWLLVIALACAVTALLAAALLVRRGATRARIDYDIAVYREQLAAVDRDVARGVLEPEAADRTRTEVSRRILEADRHRSPARPGDAPRWVNRAAAAAVAAITIGGSVGLYIREGAPGYGDLPLRERLAASAEMRETRPSQADAEAQAASAGTRPAAPEFGADYLALIDRLRATVEERPDDPRGLALLARNEAAMGNFRAAYAAQRRLIEALGARASASHYADLADMMVLAAGGYVSPEAEAVLGQALARDPRNGPARYYVGLLQAQNDRPDRAFRQWRALLEESAPDAPWVAPIRAQIEDVAMRAGQRFRLPPAGGGLAGPSAADMQAAAGMSAGDRSAMIRGMVETLSSRLDDEGGSAPEWARLINALGVLGETDRARDAWRKAQTVFEGDGAALAQIDAAADRIGLAQ